MGFNETPALRKSEKRCQGASSVPAPSRKCDTIAEIYEAYLPPQPAEDEVEGTVERSRARCLGRMACAAQRRENFRINKQIDAIVHARQRVRIAQRSRVQSSVGNANPWGFVLLRYENNR